MIEKEIDLPEATEYMDKLRDKHGLKVVRAVQMIQMSRGILDMIGHAVEDKKLADILVGMHTSFSARALTYATEGCGVHPGRIFEFASELNDIVERAAGAVIAEMEAADIPASAKH